MSRIVFERIQTGFQGEAKTPKPSPGHTACGISFARKFDFANLCVNTPIDRNVSQFEFACRECRVHKGAGSQSAVVCVAKYPGGESGFFRVLLKL